MRIMPRIDAVEAGGLMMKSAHWILALLILYGLMAVPLGMTMDRYMVSMPLFVLANACFAVTGHFIVEHERLLGFPIGDGPEGDLRDCLIDTFTQTAAVIIGITSAFLGVIVALGITSV